MRCQNSAILLTAALILLSACGHKHDDPETCERGHGQNSGGMLRRGMGMAGGMAGGMLGGGAGQGLGMGMRGLSVLTGMTDGDGPGGGRMGMGGGVGGGPGGRHGQMDDVAPCGSGQRKPGDLPPSSKTTHRPGADHAPDEEIDPSQIHFSEAQ
ncbi:hypothetical protein [Acetobacter fallax]|uniref:Glycine-rich protein n=1 Tax=Acetobacter fallax TaxID=1737473 RepID=A0ABX0KJV2_9PROT|nr:hypothetical protein [Acetobacter fallax]NHO34157.1 hypothetical protein [Acetobacter fallax]NHO37706.1 hypothetical protein [Acetobacter fallax]